MLFNELFFFFFFVFFDVVFTTKQHFSPQFSLLMLSFKKKRGKEKADEAKKRRILRIELNWMMMMESQRRTLRVFPLSLSRDR